jgi:hypothetical protein
MGKDAACLCLGWPISASFAVSLLLLSLAAVVSSRKDLRPPLLAWMLLVALTAAVTAATTLSQPLGSGYLAGILLATSALAFALAASVAALALRGATLEKLMLQRFRLALAVILLTTCASAASAALLVLRPQPTPEQWYANAASCGLALISVACLVLVWRSYRHQPRVISLRLISSDAAAGSAPPEDAAPPRKVRTVKKVGSRLYAAGEQAAVSTGDSLVLSDEPMRLSSSDTAEHLPPASSEMEMVSKD